MRRSRTSARGSPRGPAAAPRAGRGRSRRRPRALPDVAEDEAPASVARGNRSKKSPLGSPSSSVHQGAAHPGISATAPGSRPRWTTRADGCWRAPVAAPMARAIRRLRSMSPAISSGKAVSPARPMTRVPSGRPPAISRYASAAPLTPPADATRLPLPLPRTQRLPGPTVTRPGHRHRPDHRVRQPPADPSPGPAAAPRSGFHRRARRGRAAGSQGQPEPTRPVGGLVLQPYGTPVGEPRHEELPGERCDEVLVNSAKQVGGLGEKESAAVEPVAVLSRPLPRSGSERPATPPRLSDWSRLSGHSRPARQSDLPPAVPFRPAVRLRRPTPNRRTVPWRPSFPARHPTPHRHRTHHPRSARAQRPAATHAQPALNAQPTF